MNIDERLDALTHSVELLAGMQPTNEKQIKRLGKYIRSISQLVLDHETRLRSAEGDEPDDEE
jgi:hypothetical protein